MGRPKGQVLVFSLIFTLVIASLVAAFYFKATSENQMARRFLNSTKALWLAEAGISQVKGSPGLSSKNGNLGNANESYNAVVALIVDPYYSITSTGTVVTANGKSVSRTVKATVQTGSVDSTKFPYAIQTTTDLEIKGSASITPSNSWQEYATLNFNDLFGISKDTMKANATHYYTDSTFGIPVDGITWVDVASGTTMNVTGNLTGSGILIINGNVKFAGTITFDGIIYVIGTLTMTGNSTINGAVLAESSTTVDTTLSGNADINYNTTDISNALTNVQFLTKNIVAWQEI
ncbi:MAG: hypothetical protein NC923_02410 [Candidatus Omnitrophica bacterium]|nr:hypothetical protein [Candidatus Omnitrophota bacterium]